MLKHQYNIVQTADLCYSCLTLCLVLSAVIKLPLGPCCCFRYSGPVLYKGLVFRVSHCSSLTVCIMCQTVHSCKKSLFLAAAAWCGPKDSRWVRQRKPLELLHTASGSGLLSTPKYLCLTEEPMPTFHSLYGLEPVADVSFKKKKTGISGPRVKCEGKTLTQADVQLSATTAVSDITGWRKRQLLASGWNLHNTLLSPMLVTWPHLYSMDEKEEVRLHGNEVVNHIPFRFYLQVLMLLWL